MKGTLDADFEEAFIFDIANSASDVGSLQLQALDWNAVGAADPVGSAVIPADVMARVVKADVGWGQEVLLEVRNSLDVVKNLSCNTPKFCPNETLIHHKTQQVRNGEKAVVGQDRQRCVHPNPTRAKS